MGFVNNRPDRRWIKSFVSRNPSLVLQKRVNHEWDKAALMNPKLLLHVLHARERYAKSITAMQPDYLIWMNRVFQSDELTL